VYRYYLVAFAATLITAISQVLLKLGALHGNKNNSLLRAYLNLHTALGYCLLFTVTLLNVYAYKYIDLKIAVVLVPVTFVLVALLSFGVLKERLSRNNYVGASVILIGMVVFNL
jgi:drug/metabolite transporter (DMT)-like permease